MQKLLLFGVLLGAGMLSSGCASPGYTAAEREASIHRNIRYDLAQTVDDWDHFWMLRPASSLTMWNLQ